MADDKPKTRKRRHVAQLNGERWRVPYTTSEGKRQYEYLECGADELSQTEANKLAIKFLATLENDPRKRDREKAPTLKKYLKRYLDVKKEEVGASTMILERSVARYLEGYFMEKYGDDFKLDQIKPVHADEWKAAYKRGDLDHLRKRPGHLSGEKSETTVCTQVRVAKTIFNRAVEWNHIAINPFKHISHAPPLPSKDWHFVTRKELDKLLEGCSAKTRHRSFARPDPVRPVFWRAVLGLARLGGLRRSEILRVKVSDVDLDPHEKGVPGFMVYNHKTAKLSRKRPYRFVPANEQLQQLLADAIGALLPGEEYVVSKRMINSPHTLSTGLDQIFKAAELNGGKHWPEFLQSCRRSRATELAEAGIPIATHCEAMGHSPEVAEAYYLKTRPHILKQLAAI